MIFFVLSSYDHESSRHNQDDQQDGANGSSFTNYFTECKKEAITPPNSIISSSTNNNNNNDCDGSNVSSTLMQLKSEPIANPSSPETSIDAPPTSLGNNTDECAGCGRLIQVSTDTVQ
jgi:hypothetical protein